VKSVVLRPARSRGRPRLDSRLEEVLTCAAALFSSRGYAATTLADIGGKLGMSRPALYYYTKSKDDLLEQCYSWTHKRFLERLESELGEGSGRELLTRFFLIYSEMVCDNASRCFLSTDNHLLSPERQQASRDRVHAVNVIALDLLDRGVADGSLAPCDRKYAITTLFGAFNALHNLVRPGGPTPFQMGSAILRIVLNGLTPRG
jgi:AcrR family transcriptional regulator